MTLDNVSHDTVTLTWDKTRVTDDAENGQR